MAEETAVNSSANITGKNFPVDELHTNYHHKPRNSKTAHQLASTKENNLNGAQQQNNDEASNNFLEMREGSTISIDLTTPGGFGGPISSSIIEKP